MTYSNAGWYQITLVEHKDQVLVRRLLLEILFNAPATSSDGVSGIKHVDDDIGRVNDLVQLVPDTLALALVEDGFDGHGERLGLAVIAGVSTQQLVLLHPLLVGIHALLSIVGKISHGADAELDTLALSLGSKDTGKGRRLNGHLGLVLLDAIGGVLASVVDKAHGELVGLEEDLVRVLGLFSHGLTEGGQGILRDDTSVGEPLAVRLDPGIGDVSGLVAGSLCDLPVRVSLGPAVLVHVDKLDLFRIAVGISVSMPSSKGKTLRPQSTQRLQAHTDKSSRP